MTAPTPEQVIARQNAVQDLIDSGMPGPGALTVVDLRAAADEILTRGWTRRDYVDADGCVCLFGGLRAAIFGDPGCVDYLDDDLDLDRFANAAKAANRYTAAHHPAQQFAVQWNDNVCKSGQQAAAYLTAIADELVSAGRAGTP